MRDFVPPDCEAGGARRTARGAGRLSSPQKASPGARAHLSVSGGLPCPESQTHSRMAVSTADPSHVKSKIPQADLGTTGSRDPGNTDVGAHETNCSTVARLAARMVRKLLPFAVADQVSNWDCLREAKDTETHRANQQKCCAFSFVSTSGTGPIRKPQRTGRGFGTERGSWAPLSFTQCTRSNVIRPEHAWMMRETLGSGCSSCFAVSLFQAAVARSTCAMFLSSVSRETTHRRAEQAVLSDAIIRTASRSTWTLG